MPQSPGSKTGFDYARLKHHLTSSGVQKQNNALFQTIEELGSAARTFQGFIEQQFPGLSGNLNDLYTFINNVIIELNEVRNNSKYSISLTNNLAQTIPSGVLTNLTFDTTIFDDGLMFVAPDKIIANANGQYLITGRCKFPASSGNSTNSVVLPPVIIGALLQDLSVAGIDESDNDPINFFKSDGTSLGTIVIPADTFDIGQLAVDASVSRVYVGLDDIDYEDCGGRYAIGIYDGDGNFVNYIQPIDPSQTCPGNSYSIYVPSSGKLWVSFEADDNGEVWEYDKDGNFIQVIAHLKKYGGVLGYIQAAYGMHLYNCILYYSNGLTGGDNDAIYAHDLLTDTPLSPVKAPTLGFMSGMSGYKDKLYTTDGTDTIRKYNINGTLEDSFTIAAAQLWGIAVARDGNSLWVGNSNDSKIYHLRTSDGTTIESFAAADNIYTLSVPFIDCALDCCGGGASVENQVQVNVNDVRQFSSVVSGSIIPYSGLIEVLRNDVITLAINQSTGSDIDVIPSFQMHRVTYQTHDKAVGRNLIENEDGTNG